MSRLKSNFLFLLFSVLLFKHYIIVDASLISNDVDRQHYTLADKPFLAPVRLNVYEGKYVYITVGRPGKILKFKLDFSSPEILLHTVLTISQTVSRIDRVTGEGNDNFYIHSYPLRLPFRHMPPVDDLFFNNYQGTLGLSRASPLWRYWANYTLSRDRLKLGMFDRYTREDPNWLGPQIGFNLEGKTKCKIMGKEYDFSIDMTRIETLVPDEVFHQKRNLMAGGIGDGYDNEPNRIIVELISKYRNCSEHYGAWGLDIHERAVRRCENRQSIILSTTDIEQPDGVMVFSTLKHEIAGNRVVLGKSALDDISIFVNMLTNDILLAPFALNVSHVEFLWLICLLIFLLTVLWVIGVDVGGIGDPTAHLLILLTGIFLYAICILLFITNWIGFEANQFLSNLISDEAVVYIILIGVITVTFPIIHISIIYFNRATWSATPKTQKLLLLNVVLYNMWLSMVVSQQTAVDLIYMLIVSTVLAILTTTLTILILTLPRHQKNEEVWAITFLGFLLIAFSYLILVCCNLIPMLQTIFIHFKPAIIALYVVFFVVIPSIYFATIQKILSIERRLASSSTIHEK